MTRKEAIKILMNTAWLGTEQDNVETAVYMAVEALERESGVDTSDLSGYSSRLWRNSRNRAFEEALEIINDRIMLINNIVPGYDLEQELKFVREKITTLIQEENHD